VERNKLSFPIKLAIALGNSSIPFLVEKMAEPPLVLGFSLAFFARAMEPRMKLP
jgi:hypothetical protein